jgi:O-glycosyl hydrolase
VGGGAGYADPGMGRDAAQVADVDPVGAQAIEGFGASGAWWPNDLVRFTPEVQDRVAAMLFDPGGLALSVYRYNIGGGGVGVTTPARAAETFLAGPGTYDWDRDAGGRLFLRQAAARGVPALLGFVNSAPAIWTTSGRCCGGSLAPGAEPDYARYLADVVAHLRDAEGATLSYVSPMNEPDDPFPGCGQEGMAVPLGRRASVVRAVAGELAHRAPSARVVADESCRVLHHLLSAPIWLAAGGAAAVAAVTHHLYDFPDDLLLRLAGLGAKLLGKPHWMTEVCCVDSRTGRYGPQYDPTMAGAMPLASLVWQSLGVAGDTAFHWWVALSSAMGCDPFTDPPAAARPNDQGWNDGLVYYDPRYAENGNQQLYVGKRYWVLANFSRYVRPGDVRHEVRGLPPGLRALAFQSNRGWALVGINGDAPGSPPRDFRARLPLGAGPAPAPRAAVETSAARDLEQVTLPELDAGGVLSATLPAQSVTTFLLA